MNDKKTNEILKEILKWQVLQGKNILIDLIPKLLKEDNKKVVYEMTDGKNTSRVIGKKTSVDIATISNWWRE